MTQKAIGPTFPAELAARGLSGLPFSWDAAGNLFFGPQMNAQQIGWVEAAYAAHNPTAPPSLPMQARTLLAGPVTVECTSVPAINGTYAIDPTSQMQITSIASAIAAGLGLPGGGDTFNWPDSSGTQNPWPAAKFTEFARALLNFIYASAQVAQGASTSLPSSTLVIP